LATGNNFGLGALHSAQFLCRSLNIPKGKTFTPDMAVIFSGFSTAAVKIDEAGSVWRKVSLRPGSLEHISRGGW
jgi:hypothetical protein